MKVDLRTLVPNPFRDLKVDPILDDPAIRESIKKHDFWGGTVVRQTKDELQIAAGHVRVHEAINCGIIYADVFVSDKISDEDMVRIYATENATQRGVENNAIAGSVVAAIKMILMRQFIPEFFNENNEVDNEDFTEEFLRENRGGHNRDGIGWRAISKELENIPGYNENMIQLQIRNLKLSGDYDRVLGEIIAKAKAEHAAEIARLEKLKQEEEDEQERQRIEKELAAEKEATEAIDKAEHATENAAHNRTTKHGSADPLDLAGISKHLKVPSHIDVFRRLVLSDLGKRLPKDQQAALAEQLVQKAVDEDVELTIAFIQAHFYAQVSKVLGMERQEEKDREMFIRRDWRSKSEVLMNEFCRNCRGMLAAGTKIAEHNQNRPKGEPFHATGEFTNAIKNVRLIIKRLEEEKII